MHPNKDGMGGQGVGTGTGEVQDSRGKVVLGKTTGKAASAFGDKHQSPTPSLVGGPSSAGAPLTSQGGQGWASTKEGAARRK